VHITKGLLGYGVLAGVVCVVLTGVQEATRAGFDPLRDDASLLANGRWGWVEVLNFVLAGIMVVVAAAGIRRAAGAGAARTWGPALIGTYGAGLVVAGIFRADPGFGFPPGTPPGHAPVTWHGFAHLAAGGIGFLALAGACFVFARGFAAAVRPGWAVYSCATGMAFLAGFAGIIADSGNPAATVAFTAAVVAAWAWLAAISVLLYRDVTAATRPTARLEAGR
jgi:hypothetical protein